MNGGPIGTKRLDPQAAQQRFNALPEKSQQELARVVTGIVETRGRVAAQRWLEQRLKDSSVAETKNPQQVSAVGARADETERYAQLTCEVGELTPNREQLTLQAPTTMTELSPEVKAYKTAVIHAEPFTREQLALIAPNLTRQSRKVWEFLHLYAASHALSLGQSLKAQQVSFFLPAETICLVTQVPERTVYDALKRLKAQGLVDHRGHVTTLPGYGNRCDGTVFAVKLSVLHGSEARVAFADLKVSNYRDLAADIGAGRTVYRLAESTWVGDLRFSICVLLAWISSKCTKPWNTQTAIPRFLTVQAGRSCGLEAVLDVTVAPAVRRGQRIGAAAAAIARALGDQHSLAFWWKFCDALAGVAERGGRDYAPAVMLAVQREVAAKQEGFARNAAALLLARLKESGIYGEIMTA